MSSLEGLSEHLVYRACGVLYASVAVENLTSLLLATFFYYLALRIVCRDDVKQPMAAVWGRVYESVAPVAGEWWALMKQWTDMPNQPLSSRLAFCRNMNIVMCVAQATAALFSVLRWLHINNVNGLRYFGYAFTCWLAQAEFVVLLAPYVPLYKTNTVGVVLFTHAFLIAGWVGSLYDGFLFEDESWEMFFASGDMTGLVLTTKGYIVGFSACCMCILLLVQMPALALLYLFKGGCRPHPDLPYHFLRLLATVWFTWPAFPGWWLVSAEGLGLFADAKSNAVGFALLNMTSKGAFTLVMLGNGKVHRQRWSQVTPEKQNPQASWIVQSLASFEASQAPSGPRCAKLAGQECAKDEDEDFFDALGEDFENTENRDPDSGTSFETKLPGDQQDPPPFVSEHC